MTSAAQPVDNPSDDDLRRFYELVGMIGGGLPPDRRITDPASIAQVVSSLTYVARHPHAVYAWMKLIDGDPRPGGSLITGARVRAFTELRDRGFFYEPLSGYDGIVRALRLWPRIEDGTRAASASLDVVQIALDVFAGSANPAGGVLPMPAPGEVPRGHALRIVGWHANGEELNFANSWGAGWGDKGYGVVSRRYLTRNLHDAFLLRWGDHGLSAAKLRLITNSRSTSVSRVWRMPLGRRLRLVTVGDKRLRLSISPNYSVDSEAAADVLELRDAFGLRLAWAFLVHARDRTAVLKELFVWPTFRRRGYGRLLEYEAGAIARAKGSERLELWFHSADALIGLRDAGRRFGSALGYRWSWHRNELPCLEAIGSRAL